jgi:hypothetical protein
LLSLQLERTDKFLARFSPPEACGSLIIGAVSLLGFAANPAAVPGPVFHRDATSLGLEHFQKPKFLGVPMQVSRQRSEFFAQAQLLLTARLWLIPITIASSLLSQSRSG